MEVIKNDDWPDIRKAAKAVSDAVAQAGEQPDAARYMLSSLAVPGTVALSAAKVREAATLLVYDTLIAARRFELANNRLPDSLDELVPKYLDAIPPDPYSDNGESLILRTEDAVTTLYSRGFNTEDDEGDDSQGENGSPRDIVVILKRTEK